MEILDGLINMIIICGGPCAPERPQHCRMIRKGRSSCIQKVKSAMTQEARVPRDVVQRAVDVLALCVNHEHLGAQIRQCLRELRDDMRSASRPPPPSEKTPMSDRHLMVIEKIREKLDGSDPQVANLRLMAETCAQQLGLPEIERGTYRRRDRLIDWFAQNWERIESILPYVELKESESIH
jgi:hypothetical protein